MLYLQANSNVDSSTSTIRASPSLAVTLYHKILRLKELWRKYFPTGVPLPPATIALRTASTLHKINSQSLENSSIAGCYVELYLFIICLIVLFFNNILNISIIDLLNRVISGTWNVIPEKPGDKDSKDAKDVKDAKNASDEKESVPKVPEVFHISNNLYTYDDAKSVCTAYGARLATYDDIEKAYNAGAEWCGYGWSANQMALFPTQKETWTKLQDNPKHKNDCGRPGINGGYMSNPNLRFGVNCYGVKPAPKQIEKDIMNAKKNQIVPRNQQDVVLDKKVQFWKENGDKILRISSFNLDKWSEY